ncbi:MAG: class 1 fructose-bisphosphatase [Neisseriales bacterium]|nr:MAG: class 1 fructose-bisphosphatase [Neisseriales bacterium]
MMLPTLSEYLQLAYQTKKIRDADLINLLTTIANATIQISEAVRQGGIIDLLGSAEQQNSQGETQQTLDIYANQVILSNCEALGILSGMASEEMETPYIAPSVLPKKRYLLLFDPLDGSSNIAINAPIGSIFSILVKPSSNLPTTAEDFLQPGHQQIAACYALYGPQTFFVLTIGYGTAGFTLDHKTNQFILTHPAFNIPDNTTEFAINMSNQRYWEAPVQRYIHELLSGQIGSRSKNFNMRWVAAMVADVHRILMRGGVFAYPCDQRPTNRSGKLRLLYEANPMAFLVEQAGGLAYDGKNRIMAILPTTLHQRVAVFLGAKEEIEQLVDYHRA